MIMKPNNPYITTTQGMSGHFAVMIHTHEDDFPEPWESGIGRYATEDEAIQEAKEWAEAEELEYKPCR